MIERPCCKEPYLIVIWSRFGFGTHVSRESRLLTKQINNGVGSWFKSTLFDFRYHRDLCQEPGPRRAEAHLGRVAQDSGREGTRQLHAVRAVVQRGGQT